VAVLYVAVALFVMWPVLPDIFDYLGVPRNSEQVVWEADVRFVVWLVSRNARTMLQRPWDLFEGEACFPFANSVTLGEHMFGTGLVATLPWLATGDPIATYNVTLLLILVIAALAMHALVYYWTRSLAAACIGGLLFGFCHTRIWDTVHPYIHANQWTPLVLLCLHRLFDRQRWRDLILLLVCAVLQLLESYYQVLAFAGLAGIYGLVLLVQYHRSFLALWPKLLVVALGLSAAAWAIYSPYLETQALWQPPQGKMWWLYFPNSLGFGHGAYPGTVPLILAVIALLARFKPQSRPDPRIPIFVAGLFLFWCSSFWVTVPGLGMIPSPLVMMRDVLPGLAAVRAPAHIVEGGYLAVAFLGGYGAWYLTRWRRPFARAAVTVAIGAMVLVEILYPPAFQVSRGLSREMAAVQMRPLDPVLAVMDRIEPGPVLDFPFMYGGARGDLYYNPRYLLRAAYHRQRTATCYNSLRVPLPGDIATLARALPHEGAVGALSALGFRTILRHDDLMSALESRQADQVFENLMSRGHVQLRERTDAVSVYTLTSTADSDSDVRLLTLPRSGQTDRLVSMDLEGQVPITFENYGSTIFRHPEPIVPTAMLARWRPIGGGKVSAQAVRILLPAALAPGQTLERVVQLDPPPAGTYRLTVRLQDRPEIVVARQRVKVPEGDANGGRTS
jgi:hypothetical protein